MCKVHFDIEISILYLCTVSVYDPGAWVSDAGAVSYIKSRNNISVRSTVGYNCNTLSRFPPFRKLNRKRKLKLLYGHPENWCLRIFYCTVLKLFDIFFITNSKQFVYNFYLFWTKNIYFWDLIAALKLKLIEIRFDILLGKYMIIGSQENNVRRGGGCESLVHKHPWALLAKLIMMSEP